MPTQVQQRGLGFGQFSQHPVPKKINVFNSTTFGKNVPIGDIPYFEFAPSRTIDFMRARMDRTWYKTFESYQVNLEAGPATPIHLVPDSSAMEVDQPPYIGAEPIQGSTTNRKQEKATIGVNLTLLGRSGNQPQENPLSDLDKWLFVFESDRSAQHGSPTHDRNATNHNLVSTFSKLQEDPNDNDSNPIIFYDHVFDYEAPINKREIGDNYYGSITVADACVKAVYNFYVQPYETILTKFTGSSSPPESILPSLYSFLSMVQNTDAATKGIHRTQNTGKPELVPGSIDTIFERHATLNNLIKEAFVETEVVYNRGQATTTTAVSKGQYFDKYAYAFAEEAKKNITERSWNKTSPASPSSLANRFKNQIAPAANLDLFSVPADVINRFPMYCDITFSTDSRNIKFLKILEDTKLTTMLMKDFVDNEGTFSSKSQMDFNFVAAEGQVGGEDVGDGMPFNPTNYQEVPFKTSRDQTENIVSGTLDCWDLDQWVSDASTRQQPIFSQVQDGVFLGNFDHEVEKVLSPIASMNRALSVVAMTLQFEQVRQEKTRDWKDMVGGTFNGESSNPKKAYHETIFYKVEKWAADKDGNPVGTEAIQNFYFPNSTKVQEHKFLDTQVKYGKRYIYKIYAFEAVFGTKYWYKHDKVPSFGSKRTVAYPEGANLKENQARICILTEPSVKLVKVPYYQKEVVMMDKPPIMPDVDILPYRGVEDKLLFWLRGNTGNYKLNPVIIQPGDQEIINSIRLAQELSPNEPIQFKSDDYPRYFEVFRVETKPGTYEDFVGAKIAHIDTSINMDHACKTSTSGEWIDTIKPNQKYYYIFRTIDNHGHFSNPSPVYEIEMVHDGYAPFILRSTYSLEDRIDSPQVAAKSFSKYIYIKPAYTQKLLNKKESGLVNNLGEPVCDSGDCLTQLGLDGRWVRLGTSEQPLWRETMKVRIISKKTGKRIDINIKFKHEPTERADENNRNNNLC